MTKIPVLFIGHGSPMNSIEDNEYSKTWKTIAENIIKPKAIVSISAHWFVKGSKIMNDKISVFNKSCELGSLTMTSYLWE